MSFSKSFTDIEKLCALPKHQKENAEDKVWISLKAEVRAVQKDADALSKESDDVIKGVLGFLIAWHDKKKILRTQVITMLSFLLQCAKWSRAACADPELSSSLRTLFSEDTGMLSRLECSVSEEPEKEESPACDVQKTEETESSSRPRVNSCSSLSGSVSEEPGKEESPACDVQKTVETESSGRPRVNSCSSLSGDDVQGCMSHISEAILTMQAFAYSFPENPLGTKRDEAAQCFRKLYHAVNRLKGMAERKPAKEISDALDVFERYWRDVFRFLESTMASRSHLVVQVKFVMDTLPQLCGSLQQMFDDDELGKQVDAYLSPQNGYSLLKDAINSGGKIQWMWADANVLPLPGFYTLARLDPVRWSNPLEPHELSADLAQQKTWTRTVRMCAAASHYTVVFETCYDATKWLKWVLTDN